MSVQNVQTKILTPAQQAELKSLLAAAKTKEEKASIYTTYLNACGVNVAGTVLERHGSDKGNIVSQTTSHKLNVGDIINSMVQAGFKLDDKSKAELLTALTDAGVAVDKEGNISIENVEAGQKLNNVMAKFARSKQEPKLTFDDKTDIQFIEKMVEAGAIKKNEDGTFAILNRELTEQYLNKLESTSHETGKPINLDVPAKEETTTVREEGVVKVGDDLKHDKAARKKAEADFKAEIQKWADEPENQSTMLLSIADHKYSKQIDKRAAKIAKEYANKKSDVELFKDYLNEYATDGEKVYMISLLKALDEKLTDEELLAALHKGTNSNKIKDLSNQQDRTNALYYYALQECKFNKDILIDKMATIDVMSERSPEQVVKDKLEFIDEEAKRQTEAAETRQNIKNTRVYFSEEARKAAEGKETNDSIEHNDIGDLGRKLVMANPERFCKAGTQADHDFEQPKGTFWKFDEGLFKEFCQDVCNGSLDKLVDTDREGFQEEGNLNLQEGRDVLKEQFLRDENGNPRSIEQLFGNANGNVGVRELKKFRKFIESSGYSVDKDRTRAKRALHVFKEAGIGAALGLATAGLSSVAAGAVSIAGETAAQFVGYKGVTDSSVYSFTTQDRIISDETTFNFRFNGEEYTQTVHKDILVPGEKYDIPIKGQEYSGTVRADGQHYADRGNNHSKTSWNGAIFAGVIGGVHGAATAGGVYARSRSDLTVNLRREDEETDTKDTKFKLNIPQPTVVTVRSGQIGSGDVEIGNKACKLRVRTIYAPSANGKPGLNKAESKKAMVSVYYGIDINSPQFEKVYKFIMEDINGLQKYGDRNYTADTTYYLPERIPATVAGIDFELKFNPEDPKERQRLSEIDIPTLVGGGTNKKAASNTQKIPGELYNGRGRIDEPKV